MVRLLFLSGVLLSSAAFAKPWAGMDPGFSTSQDILLKFGEPTRKVVNTEKGFQTWLYAESATIKGTSQVQFKIRLSDDVLERIDVYPAVKVTLSEVIKNYGTECGPAPQEPCFFKRNGEAGRVYFLYLKLGLAVFFNDDKSTVKSLAFLEPGK